MLKTIQPKTKYWHYTASDGKNGQLWGVHEGSYSDVIHYLSKKGHRFVLYCREVTYAEFLEIKKILKNG